MHIIRNTDSSRRRSLFSKKLPPHDSTGQHPKTPSATSAVSRSQSLKMNRPVGQFTVPEERQSPSPAASDDTLPADVNFDSEEETCIGEPLIQDFAADNIPEAFRPYTSKKTLGSEREISSDEESNHQVALSDAAMKAADTQPKQR